jgi:hypothetical protein
MFEDRLRDGLRREAGRYEPAADLGDRITAAVRRRERRRRLRAVIAAAAVLVVVAVGTGMVLAARRDPVPPASRPDVRTTVPRTLETEPETEPEAEPATEPATAAPVPGPAAGEPRDVPTAPPTGPAAPAPPPPSSPGAPVLSAVRTPEGDCSVSWSVDDGGSPVLAFLVTTESAPAPTTPDGAGIGTALALERTLANAARVERGGGSLRVAAVNALGGGPEAAFVCP